MQSNVACESVSDEEDDVDGFKLGTGFNFDIFCGTEERTSSKTFPGMDSLSTHETVLKAI